MNDCNGLGLNGVKLILELILFTLYKYHFQALLNNHKVILYSKGRVWLAFWLQYI